MAKNAVRADLIYGTSMVVAMMVAPTAAHGQTAASPAGSAQPQIGSTANPASHSLTAAVLAQSETDAAQLPDAPDEEAAQSGGLQQIVVTARRREETAQSIPVSVQAITAAEIEQRDLTSLEKIAAATPNFTIARSSNHA